MKGKELNSGIRGGLWDKKHSEAMGMSVYLFGWCVHRQTNARGWVLSGKSLTYAEIALDTGFEERTLRRWASILVQAGYIKVDYRAYKRLAICVLNAQKFQAKNDSHFHTSASISTGGDRPHLADKTQSFRPHLDGQVPDIPATSGRSNKNRERRRTAGAPEFPENGNRNSRAGGGCANPSIPRKNESQKISVMAEPRPVGFESLVRGIRDIAKAKSI